MGQVGSGNTATEPAGANDEFAVSFTDGSINGDHPMEVENTTMPSHDVSHADEANQPSKKRSHLDDVSSKEECGSLSGRFNGVNIEDLVVLETGAGSARLTKAARAKGFQGIAVDHSSERSCGVDICEFELADPEQLESLLQYIRKYAAFIVANWIAPSCGTAIAEQENDLCLVEGKDRCLLGVLTGQINLMGWAALTRSKWRRQTSFMMQFNRLQRVLFHWTFV